MLDSGAPSPAYVNCVQGMHAPLDLVAVARGIYAFVYICIYINPGSCRLLLLQSTAHLPKLEFPVKRNENRSNQTEKHTYTERNIHIYI